MRTGIGFALAFSITAFAAPVLAQEQPAQQITEPQWITDPQQMNLADAFPPVPLALARSGRAVLDCVVALDTTAACDVVDEAPSGMGFGAAALRLSRDWRFTPRMVDGQPQPGRKRVPLNFALGPDVQAAPIGDGFTVRARRHRGGGQFYPEPARVSGVEGATLIGCVMRNATDLDCGVESEEPIGQGFGQAAIRAVVDSYAMRERGGFAPGAVIRIPVEFRLTGD